MRRAAARPETEGAAVIPLRPASARTDGWTARYREHAPRFLGFLTRLCGNPTDAEDIAQEAFLLAHDRWDQIPVDRFGAFLRGVGVRKVQHLFRRRRLLLRLGIRSDEPQVDVAHAGASPEQLAELARLFEALGRLDPKARVAWSLRRVEGYTVEEAARAVGCSPATLKRRVALGDRVVAARVDAAGAKP